MHTLGSRWRSLWRSHNKSNIIVGRLSLFFPTRCALRRISRLGGRRGNEGDKEEDEAEGKANHRSPIV
eukprot:6002780-Pyramimonas_sp.AAC.1